MRCACVVRPCVVRPFPTCGQEAVGSQQQLRGDLGFGFALVLEGGEVPLVLIGRHFFPIEVIRCGKGEEQRHSL